MDALERNMQRAYANYNAKQDENPDLAYRWETGMDDWDVLAELWGCSVPLAKAYVNEGLEDMTESALAWKQAGQTFDWLLGGCAPAPIRFELRGYGVDPNAI